MNKLKLLLNWLIIKFFYYKNKNKHLIQQNNNKKYKSYIDIVKSKRNQFHKDMDYLWKEKHITRNMLYIMMSREMGKPFHTSYLYKEIDFILAYECLKKVKEQISRNQLLQDIYLNDKVCKAIKKPIKRKTKKFKA